MSTSGDNEEDNPPTGIELASTQDYARLKRAYNVAVFNITQLNDQRQALLDTLGKALNLVEHLIIEMRAAGVTPSGKAVFSKAALDAAMKKLTSMQ